MAKNTATAEVTKDDVAVAMESYMKFREANKDVIEAVTAAQAEFDAAKAKLDAANEAASGTQDEAKRLVSIIGADPLGLVAKSNRGGPRGPRDPKRRETVLSAMTGVTIKELMEATGEDRNYVQSVISSLTDKPGFVKAGESGSFTYSYTPES